jgi:serine/threonine-protein kinase
MGSTAKQVLERAIAQKLLTEPQALELAKLRHARKGRDGVAPAVEDLAIEKGYLSAEQARRLRQEQEGFELKREIGGYRIIEKIGSGTMGTVYKAKQVSLDRVVAMKVLAPHLSRKRDYVEQFLREARAVARLNHPNVISGIDVGEEEGVRYFVMEYASGLTVGEILKRGGAMDESRVAKVALQIARALEHAHEAGLVHRDVKPDNILITKNGTAKLCDLGLAKDRPEGGRALGTPHYISPEQAEGVQEADIRSDLYSFGATLYHMLAGRTPFEGKAKAVMLQQVNDEPPPLSGISPDVSTSMEALVRRLMRKRPEERFQSPRELIGALEAYEAEQRQEAARPDLRPQVRRKRR